MIADVSSHPTCIVLEEKQIPKSNLRRDTRGSGELQML